MESEITLKPEKMSIYKKLLESKKEFGKIAKDSKNPFFKSKYFDINSLLDHIEPILQKNGLLLLQPITDGKVITEIIDVETGDRVSSEIVLPMLNDPQKLGSAVSYYRRYTAQSLLGLQAEDDDANSASKKPTPPKKTAIQQARPTPTKTWITEKQFESAKGFTTEQLEQVFNKFQFRKPEQKEELQEIYNKLKG